MFCFECGEFHYGLFRIVWVVLCNAALAGLIFYCLSKLIEVLLGAVFS